MDRRKPCYMHVALLLYVICWFAATSIAAGGPESTAEYAEDIMALQWKAIMGLTGLVQVLVGFIYISGIRSVKDSIRKLFDRIDELEREKLDKDDHAIFCDKVNK